MLKKSSLLFEIAIILILAGTLEVMLFIIWEDSVETLRGDAVAINMVGSQRMRLLKMAFLAEDYIKETGKDPVMRAKTKAMLGNEMSLFEGIILGLRDGDSSYDLKKANDPVVTASLNQGIDEWNRTVKPVLESLLNAGTSGTVDAQQLSGLRTTVFAYVDEIDEIAGLFESYSERKVNRLRKLQFVFLFLSGIVAAGSLIYIYAIIIKPVKRIVRVSKAVVGGDISRRVEISSSDEMGELGNAFNEITAQSQAHINELNRKTMSLEYQEAFLDSIIDNLPFNIYIVDKELTIVKWNRSRESGPFALSRDIAIGKKLWNIYDINLFRAASPKNRDEREREFEKIFATGKIMEKEEVSGSFEGKRFFKVTKIPLIVKGDKPDYIMTAIEDITERRLLETRIMAKERLAAVGELAAGVAHEINNPMASMAICAESLLKSAAPENFTKQEEHEHFVRYLKIIEEEIFRCKNITTSLLNFSRERTLVAKDVDVNDALNETVKLLRIQHKYRGFIIKTGLESTLPVISADEGQLRQVFLSLMINAFEAMGPSGVLEISTSSAIENGTKAVKVSFKDNGCGIPAANINKIFTTFFTTKGMSGTGLGLPICYGIVSQHGGKIEVASEVGMGSIFTVILPVIQRQKSLQ